MAFMKNSWLIFLPVLFFTSCATITRGVHEKLYVNSEPSGAEVKLSSGERAITPAKIVKSRKQSFTVTVSKAGYNSQTIKVESRFSPTGGTAMVGNVLGSAVIGVGVDAVSGATSSLYPNPVSVRLLPVEKSRTVTTKKRSGSVTVTPRSSSASKHTATPASKKTSPPSSAKATTTSAKPSPTPEEPPIKNSPPPPPVNSPTPYSPPPILQSVPDKTPPGP
jgi:hypothetical protein